MKNIDLNELVKETSGIKEDTMTIKLEEYIYNTENSPNCANIIEFSNSKGTVKMEGFFLIKEIDLNDTVKIDTNKVTFSPILNETVKNSFQTPQITIIFKNLNNTLIQKIRKVENFIQIYFPQLTNNSELILKLHKFENIDIEAICNKYLQPHLQPENQFQQNQNKIWNNFSMESQNQFLSKNKKNIKKEQKEYFKEKRSSFIPFDNYNIEKNIRERNPGLKLNNPTLIPTDNKQPLEEMLTHSTKISFSTYNIFWVMGDNSNTPLYNYTLIKKSIELNLDIDAKSRNFFIKKTIDSFIDPLSKSQFNNLNFDFLLKIINDYINSYKEEEETLHWRIKAEIYTLKLFILLFLQEQNVKKNFIEWIINYQNDLSKKQKGKEIIVCSYMSNGQIVEATQKARKDNQIFSALLISQLNNKNKRETFLKTKQNKNINNNIYKLISFEENEQLIDQLEQTWETWINFLIQLCLFAPTEGDELQEIIEKLDKFLSNDKRKYLYFNSKKNVSKYDIRYILLKIYALLKRKDYDNINSMLNYLSYSGNVYREEKNSDHHLQYIIAILFCFILKDNIDKLSNLYYHLFRIISDEIQSFHFIENNYYQINRDFFSKMTTLFIKPDNNNVMITKSK